MAKSKHSGAPPRTPPPRTELVRLADLVPHPEQEAHFPHDEARFRAMVESVLARGVDVPIDVLPGGNAAGLRENTIISGHTRVLAARAAGLEKIVARLRYDLITTPRAGITELFLRDNVERRQLTRLQEARIAVAIYKARLEGRGQSAGNVLTDAKLRDEVAKIMGASGKTLHRYMKVLGAPVEVQDAFEGGQLRLVEAVRVAGLPKKTQAELAARLRAGEETKAAFAAYFPPKARGHVKPDDAVAAFARALAAAGADLDGRLADVKPGPVSRHEGQLRSGVELLKRLLRKLDGAA